MTLQNHYNNTQGSNFCVRDFPKTMIR